MAICISYHQGISDKPDTEDNSDIIQQKQQEIEKLTKRNTNLIEMRADDEISREEFKSRKADIENRIAQLQAEIQKLSPPNETTEEDVNYEKKIQILQYALKQYTDGDLDEDISESVIEAFVIKIVASKDSFDWYLRFSPDTPHKCRVEGSKRKPKLVNVNSPSLVESGTGCYQEQVS